MQVTARGLNRATLARQLLLDRQPMGVVGALRRVVALQAQSLPLRISHCGTGSPASTPRVSMRRSSTGPWSRQP
jgi:hypothetical protein